MAIRYAILDVQAVSAAVKGASGKSKTAQAEKEKKDRAMAKVILDKLGMETEKYRLGYTKVGDFQYNFRQ